MAHIPEVKRSWLRPAQTTRKETLSKKQTNPWKWPLALSLFFSFEEYRDGNQNLVSSCSFLVTSSLLYQKTSVGAYQLQHQGQCNHCLGLCSLSTSLKKLAMQGFRHQARCLLGLFLPLLLNLGLCFTSAQGSCRLPPKLRKFHCWQLLWKLSLSGWKHPVTIGKEESTGGKKLSCLLLFCIYLSGFVYTCLTMLVHLRAHACNVFRCESHQIQFTVYLLWIKPFVRHPQSSCFRKKTCLF